VVYYLALTRPLPSLDREGNLAQPKGSNGNLWWSKAKDNSKAGLKGLDYRLREALAPLTLLPDGVRLGLALAVTRHLGPDAEPCDDFVKHVALLPKAFKWESPFHRVSALLPSAVAVADAPRYRKKVEEALHSVVSKGSLLSPQQIRRIMADDFNTPDLEPRSTSLKPAEVKVKDLKDDLRLGRRRSSSKLSDVFYKNNKDDDDDSAEKKEPVAAKGKDVNEDEDADSHEQEEEVEEDEDEELQEEQEEVSEVASRRPEKRQKPPQRNDEGANRLTVQFRRPLFYVSEAVCFACRPHRGRPR
jgi:hypothetical protein